MTAAVTLHEIPPSPDSMKVRIALGYKKIDYRRAPVTDAQHPGDRTDLIRLSRQPLAPVLEHGDRVIFDSASILRYLEANFPDSAPLFSADWETMRQIEEWEWMARLKISDPFSIAFDQARRPQPDAAACRRASALMHELTGPIEAQLARSPFLVTDHPTAADVTAVPYIWHAMIPDALAATGPTLQFLHGHLKLGKERERTRAWVEGIIGYDRETGGKRG